ncbi:MAG: DUF6089 family protein [Paludibacter sp.]|jgi:hypothetical protein|nr:DUF6089 family protein [Paludibacter sp.]
MEKRIKILILAVVVLHTVNLSAQDDFYYSEIGVNGGLSAYAGDLGLNVTKNFQPSLGLIYRQKFDTRFAVHGNWQMTRLHYEQQAEHFIDNSYNIIDLCGEFNFLDLERKVYRPFSRGYSTFIFGGPSFLLQKYENEPLLAAGITAGVGLKLIISNSLNLNIILAQRLYFSDKLEGLKAYNNPKGLNGSNPLNNDLMTTLTVAITFNFWKKDCDCHF